MISFLIRKMWKNKWMMLCLLIGNILLVGIVSGTPLYSQATMQRILQKDLQSYQIEQNSHPATVNLRYTFNYVKSDLILKTYNNTKNNYLSDILNKIDIPVTSLVEQITMDNWNCLPDLQREMRPNVRPLVFMAREKQYDNINLISGRLPAEELVDGNILECLENETTLIRQDLLLDELLIVDNVTLPGDLPLYVRIVGQFESNEDGGAYWIENPNQWYKNLIISEELARNFFINEYSNEYRVYTTWTAMLDYTQMKAEDVPGYLSALDTINETYNTSENYQGNAVAYAALGDLFPQPHNKGRAGGQGHHGHKPEFQTRRNNHAARANRGLLQPHGDHIALKNREQHRAVTGILGQFAPPFTPALFLQAGEMRPDHR